jgi:hypothetical protein
VNKLTEEQGAIFDLVGQALEDIGYNTPKFRCEFSRALVVVAATIKIREARITAQFVLEGTKLMVVGDRVDGEPELTIPIHNPRFHIKAAHCVFAVHLQAIEKRLKEATHAAKLARAQLKTMKRYDPK